MRSWCGHVKVETDNQEAVGSAGIAIVEEGYAGRGSWLAQVAVDDRSFLLSGVDTIKLTIPDRESLTARLESVYTGRESVKHMRLVGDGEPPDLPPRP
jgi:hypothetical protein